MVINLNKLWEIVKDRETCVLQLIGLQRAGRDLLPEKQQNFMQKKNKKNTYLLWMDVHKKS